MALFPTIHSRILYCSWFTIFVGCGLVTQAYAWLLYGISYFTDQGSNVGILEINKNTNHQVLYIWKTEKSPSGGSLYLLDQWITVSHAWSMAFFNTWFPMPLAMPSANLIGEEGYDDNSFLQVTSQPRSSI